MLYRLRLAVMTCACCLCWALLGALIGFLARVPGIGFVIGLVFGVIYALLGYWASEKFALELYDAKLLDSGQAPRLYEMVAQLSASAHLDHPPLVYVTPFKAPNAFVIGGRKDEYTLAISDGLTRSLDREEVRAVLAVLIARIAEGAAKPWSVASALAGLPLHGARSASVNDTLGDRLEIDPSFGLTVVGKTLLLLCNPLSAALLRLVYAPAAVLAADRRAVQLTDDLISLASALTKIADRLPDTDVEAGSYRPSTALLFVVAPLPVSSLLAESPDWLRTFAAFPGRLPTVAERTEQLAVTPSRADVAAA